MVEWSIFRTPEFYDRVVKKAEHGITASVSAIIKLLAKNVRYIAQLCGPVPELLFIADMIVRQYSGSGKTIFSMMVAPLLL